MISIAARIELHYASQILAACADALLPHRPDDGHTAMIWRTPSLVGETGLVLRCPDLVLAAPSGRELSLRGRTLREALAWASVELGAAGATLRDYDLPASPLRSGATFEASRPDTSELARVFDDGFAAVTANREDSSVRVWPHHFDLGAVLPDGIGIGLSPGDGYYPEPYYYVTPARAVAAAPAIHGGGFWRADGWQGAVLLAASGGAPAVFMADAIAALRTLSSAQP